MTFAVAVLLCVFDHAELSPVQQRSQHLAKMISNFVRCTGMEWNFEDLLSFYGHLWG